MDNSAFYREDSVKVVALFENQRYHWQMHLFGEIAIRPLAKILFWLYQMNFYYTAQIPKRAGGNNERKKHQQG